MKKIIAMAALAAISATASAAGNLFTDGSFESITQAAGTWNTYNAVPGWTVTKASGGASTNGLEIRNTVAGTAEDGANFIELDGYENDKISQSFATVIGKAYEITFYYADRTDVSSSFLQGAGTVPGSGGFAYSYTGVGTTTYAGAFGAFWHEAVIDFTATSANTTFSIWGAGTSDGYGTSFDNFTAVAAVPEPATLGLFAAGLAVLGMSARRRRQ
jgi:hypothetical protein